MSRSIVFAGAIVAIALISFAYTPVDASAQQFGGAVASINEDVFVGYVQSTEKPGIVHVYRDVDGKWTEVQQFSASDAIGIDDRFGRAMATADGRLFIGATTRSNTTGAVYIFERDDSSGEWVQSSRLIPPAAEEGDAFGRSISINGDQMLVGAAGADSTTGKVYVYHRGSDGTWKSTDELQPTDLMSGDLFGLHVTSSADHALVTRFTQGIDGRLPQIYAYQFRNGSWIAKGTLPATGHDEQTAFGASVATVGNRAFVGGQGFEDHGGVFLFTFDAATNQWRSDGVLTANDEGGSLGFGAAVTIADGLLYVGAPNAADGAGRVYVYTLDAMPASKPSATIESAGSLTNFGGVLSVTKDKLLAGIPFADFGLGRAGIFTRVGTDGWKLASEVFRSVSELQAVKGEQVRCQDGDASGFGCEKVDLLSFMPVSALGGGRGVRTNDVWGWTDPQTGKEYALVGRMDGTSFVDISDPYNPLLVGNLPMTNGAQANAWRDIKVYKDHAYVVADGAGDHGMQIFDLRQLRDVTDAPVTFKETAFYDKIASAHNIVINEDTGFAYAVGSNSGGETCGGGSHMIDIRDPENPKFAGCFAHEGTGRAGTGYTHDAQCVVYSGPDTRYSDREICFGANETALSIADVTDKDSTVTLAAAEYPNVGYAHQGWLTEDHRYFLLDDELDELSGLTDGTRTLIWDVSDLEDPQLIKEYISKVKSSDHNLYVKGNLVYQSNYVSGLRILDISDIMNPVEVGNFDTVPGEANDPGFDGSWSNYPFFKSGVIVVTSGAEGLFLVKKADLGL